MVRPLRTSLARLADFEWNSSSILQAVLRLIIGQRMKLAAAGLAIGLIAAIVATRLIKTLLFEVGANDPTTLCAVTLLLGIVALLACWIPAWRATQVDPLRALRHE